MTATPSNDDPNKDIEQGQNQTGTEEDQEKQAEDKSVAEYRLTSAVMKLQEDANTAKTKLLQEIKQFNIEDPNLDENDAEEEDPRV